jgi:hypothetical protein
VAVAYKCDFCKTLVEEVFAVSTVVVRGDDGDAHEVTFVLNYQGSRQGEYCASCVPVVVQRAVHIMSKEGRAEHGSGGKQRSKEDSKKDGTPAYR